MSTPFTIPDYIDWGEKQIFERPAFSLNCRPYMSAGETIDWFGVVIYPDGQSPESSPMPSLLYSVAFTTSRVQFRPMEGESGVLYKVRLRWTTSQGGQYEIEGKYKVVEKI